MILGIERGRNGASREIFLVERQEGVVVCQGAVTFAKFCGGDLIGNEPAGRCAFAIIFRSREMIDHSGPPTLEKLFILLAVLLLVKLLLWTSLILRPSIQIRLLRFQPMPAVSDCK